MDSLNEVLLREGYGSPRAVVKEWALILALSKLEKYRAECEFFQEKYGATLQKFEERLRSTRGHEDFEKEDDADDWEFCSEAVKWWENKIREIRDAADK